MSGVDAEDVVDGTPETERRDVGRHERTVVADSTCKLSNRGVNYTLRLELILGFSPRSKQHIIVWISSQSGPLHHVKT